MRDGVYDTDWFPVSNFIAYMVLNGFGFAYVNLITHNRRKPFITGNVDTFDFTVLIMIITPLVFFNSTITLWRSRHAIDEIKCAEDENELCYSYSRWDVFSFNYFWWTSWYFFGLHTSYKDAEIFEGVFSFAISFDEIADWSITTWIVISVTSVLGVFGMIYLGIKIKAMGMIRWYSCQFLLLVALIGLMIPFFPNRTTHIHHWTMGMIATTFLSSPDFITAAIHGIMNGMMVEGGATWGYDFVWKRSDLSLE